MSLASISKEFRVPSAEEHVRLKAEQDPTEREYVEREMMAEWAKKEEIKNANIWAQNDAIKKQRDEIIAQGNLTARQNKMTSLIMGQVLADMTVDYRRMVMHWQRMSIDPNDPQKLMKAKDMTEAYAIYDWLFVFEVMMVTHLHADDKLNATTAGNGLRETQKNETRDRISGKMVAKIRRCH